MPVVSVRFRQNFGDRRRGFKVIALGEDYMYEEYDTQFMTGYCSNEFSSS